MTPIPYRNTRRPVFGFFGGSFDPIQKGHLALARAALRERKLARVFLVVSPRSPLKRVGPRATAAERARLVLTAIRGHAGLSLGRWEMDHAGPAFTYRTLRRLRRRFPNRRWELILGEDSWRHFRRWRRWREIAETVPLVVGRRAGARGARGPSGAIFLKSRIPPVSSTEARKALSGGGSARRWLDPRVYRRIKAEGLYA